MCEIMILQSIQEGWLEAKRMIYFGTGKESNYIKPEYLITTCIAQKLQIINQTPGDPFLIQIEQSTKSAFENCYTSAVFKRVNNRTKIWLRGKYNAQRNGRMDIVISEPVNMLQSRTQYVIEVKAFMPQRSEIEKECIRISQIANQISGREVGNEISSLRFGYLTFALDFSKHIGLSQSDLQKTLESETKYIRYINSNQPEIRFFEISRHINVNPNIDDEDTHLFIGVVVIIRNIYMSRTSATQKSIV